MSKKKSLGHNPLAYSMLGHASFDFIPDKEKEKNRTTKPDIGESESAEKVNKVTVSYYLEEPLVEQIKKIAEKNHTSYSSMISQMLKESLNSPED